MPLILGLWIALVPGFGQAHQPSAESLRAFEQADALVRAGKCAEALPGLEKLLRAEPSFADALFAAGACYTQQAKPDRAEEVLRRYIALEPRSAEGRALLGLALLSNGRLEPARTELSRALALDSTQQEAAKALARVHVLEGNPVKAVALLRDRERTAEADEELHIVFAQALAASGDKAGAVTKIETLLATSPDQTADVYVLMVNALRDLGRTDQAFDVCERGLKLHPNSARLESAYVSLPLQAIGRRLEERVKRADLEDVDEMVSLALLMSSVDRKKAAGAVETAEALLERALKVAPRSARAHFAYGRCLRLLRREDQATAALSQAAVLATDDHLRVLIYTFLGTTEAQRSRMETAEDAFQKAMQLNRKLPVFVSEAALEFVHFLAQAGRDAESQALAEEILRWEPFFYPARMERAKRLADSGDYNAAIQDAELVARNMIADKDLARSAHALLARIYHRLGRDQEAREHETWIRGQ